MDAQPQATREEQQVTKGIINELSSNTTLGLLNMNMNSLEFIFRFLTILEFGLVQGTAVYLDTIGAAHSS